MRPPMGGNSAQVTRSLDPCDTAQTKAAWGFLFNDPHAMAWPVNLRTESRFLNHAE